MLVQDGEDFLGLTVIWRAAAGTQEAGNTRFAVRLRVTSHDTAFTAETWCYVELRVLAAFAEQLRRLEESRQGSAVLESMTPGELCLEIRITDRAGLVAAFGQVGHHCYRGTGQALWTVLPFAIPFCPTELPSLVREFADLATAPPA